MIFISYKSNYSNLVRNISEILYSAGNPVWFAEHFIMLENYKDFLEAIDAGIDRSEAAIFFTNEMWANSDWCQYEKNKLTDKLSPENIIEINLLPPNEKSSFPYISGTANYLSLPVNEQTPSVSELNSIIYFISERLGIGISDNYPVKGLPNRTLLPNMGVEIDLGEFKASLSENALKTRNILDPWLVYRAKINHTDIGLTIFSSPFNSPLHDLSESIEDDFDSLSTYKSYMDYARGWLKKFDADNTSSTNSKLFADGLHLFFKDNRSHFCLTYHSEVRLDNLYTMWERRYVIPTKGKVEKESGEVSLLFHAKLTGSYEAQKKTFWKFSYYFDSIVQSFRYTPPSTLYRFLNNFAAYIAKGILLGGFAFLTRYLLLNQSDKYWIILGAFLTGLFVGDILHFFISSTYKRITSLMQPAEENLATSYYQLVSTSIFNLLFSTPLFLGFGFLLAFRKSYKIKTLLFIITFALLSYVFATLPEMNISQYAVNQYLEIIFGVFWGTIGGYFFSTVCLSKLTRAY
ncbi:MAG: toll/interleukin-1 receptor domain-containing protein [Lewinellaceae bacterium]|nr:toll/interleukin-1 receptor domain-containing protein [Lewinellaceae bacterium]